uniref:Uncharacterized protein n=1 Tax=Anopheles coluzzii TaxID=1518534 RepID=A0A8W7PIG2_ANOCL
MYSGLTMNIPPTGAGAAAGGYLHQQQQQHHHQPQPPSYAPPSAPTTTTTTMGQQPTVVPPAPAMVEEEEDDFLSEITIQFDDEVQTLYKQLEAAASHPVPTPRPVQMTETGPLGDVAPATVLQSLPTPVQTATVRAAVEAPKAQPPRPPPPVETIEQQQPTELLLTRLKQEPLSEEVDEQVQETEKGENVPVPEQPIVTTPFVAPPVASSPRPPTPTPPATSPPPLVDTKPTIIIMPEVNVFEPATAPAAVAAVPIAALETSVLSAVAAAASMTATATDEAANQLACVDVSTCFDQVCVKNKMELPGGSYDRLTTTMPRCSVALVQFVS